MSEEIKGTIEVKSTRRYRIVSITPELLLELMQNAELSTAVSFARHQLPAATRSRVQYLATFDGVPADAKIVGASYDEYRRKFLICVHSPSFEPVPDAERIPDLPVSITRHSFIPQVDADAEANADANDGDDSRSSSQDSPADTDA